MLKYLKLANCLKVLQEQSYFRETKFVIESIPTKKLQAQALFTAEFCRVFEGESAIR